MLQELVTKEKVEKALDNFVGVKAVDDD